MDFELLDGYLLHAEPTKAKLIESLLAEAEPPPAAHAYLEGISRLGARTPDLALLALRLTLAGKAADDAAVVRLRNLSERARQGGPEGASAASAYRKELT